MRTFIAQIPVYLFPRLQDAIFIGLLVAVAMQGPQLLNGDGDLGRHITIGNYILESRDIPTRDIFSHTMSGERLVPHEWLAQVSFAVVHTWMGLTGLVLLIAILIALTFTLTYREMLRQNIFRVLALAIGIVAAYSSSLHWLARPHIFTFLFAALWTYQLANPGTKVWVFPLLMLIWVNTHGAFIVGFVVWMAHLAGWMWEYLNRQSEKEAGIRLLKIGTASAVVTFLNPAGWRLWETSVGYLGRKLLVDQTIEYQSPNFHNWSTWPFLLLLLLGIIAAGRGRRLPPYEIILFTCWTAMSLYSARNIPLFAIIVAPSIANSLQSVVENVYPLIAVERKISNVENRLKGIVLPLLAVVFLTIAFATRQSAANQFDARRFPVRAVDWLVAHPLQGKMYNNFIWGGYLLYRLWPQESVFIDGQTDFYGEALTREYLEVATLAEGWEAVLEKHEISWVIVQSDKPLVEVLEKDEGWNVVYADDTAAILQKP